MFFTNKYICRSLPFAKTTLSLKGEKNCSVGINFVSIVNGNTIRTVPLTKTAFERNTTVAHLRMKYGIRKISLTVKYCKCDWTFRDLRCVYHHNEVRRARKRKRAF